MAARGFGRQAGLSPVHHHVIHPSMSRRADAEIDAKERSRGRWAGTGFLREAQDMGASAADAIGQ